MIRQFVRALGNNAGAPRPEAVNPEELFSLHPLELMALLDLAWERGNRGGTGLPGVAQAGQLIRPGTPAATIANSSFMLSSGGGRLGVLWDHLIYAYMLENTRIYEIFRRVLQEFLHGEKFGQPSQVTLNWLRTTEELFYRDPPSFSITAISSHVRPDLRSSRRNAYHRMFGMDLNHGLDDGKPYPYLKAEAANAEFVSTFEEFLREVWVGMTNFNNQIGTNPIDDQKIADLAERLSGMLTTRRSNGTISREEFVYVAMMAWFHLTIETNNSVMRDLRANATTPEQQLFKVAEAVRLPAHGLSRSFFEIANPVSRILIQLETGIYNDRNAVPALYIPATGGPEEDMRNIIHHWSIISGRDLKARKVAAA